MKPRKPEIENLLKVLRRERPDRPVLFELLFDSFLYKQMARREPADDSDLEYLKVVVDAYANYGYDYAGIHGSAFAFPTKGQHKIKTVSANDGAIITDRASYDKYVWPDPSNFDSSRLEKIKDYLPEGMKLMVLGPGGILENAMALTGYDNMCYMLYEDPDLLAEIFNQVGSRILKYYEICVPNDTVGVVMSNDDWGFNSQTFLSVKHMRQYVFPWHKKIVEVAHRAGKPAVLHSCGYLNDVMEDVIVDMGYDGKHSYEDKILPVEECYRRWGDRIAIMGGLDLDFLIRSSKDAIKERARGMLELSREKGGYALGHG